MLQPSTATYSFSYIIWLQLAAECGSCSQLILTSPLKPIFHCDAKPFALGTFAPPNAKDSIFASPNAKIPTLVSGIYFASAVLHLTWCWECRFQAFFLRWGRKLTRRKTCSQWNMGLRFVHPLFVTLLCDTLDSRLCGQATHGTTPVYKQILAAVPET